MEADDCAKLTISLASKNQESLNGKFINLQGKEIAW